jgi:hypothetical protein
MPAPRDAPELLRAATAALRSLGAEVRLFADAENCVRPNEEPAELPFVIEVQGVPNLLHELAHVVLLGRVAKDHATEYSKIPFDLASEHGRKLLFEELACCLASSLWHPGGDADARAWFDEQVGIQNCFFGFAQDEAGLARFLAAADAQLRAHRGELDGAIARATRGIGSALAGAGASIGVARPRRALEFDDAWRRLAGAYTRAP